MPKDFAEWLRGELDRRGLSRKDPAVRAGMTDPPVGQIARGNVRPAAESVVKIAAGLGEDPVPLLRLAGYIPDLGPETTDEEEAVRILRALPYHLRQVAVWMLRGMCAEYLQGDEPRILQEGDRVRVVLIQEGTAVAETEEPDHYRDFYIHLRLGDREIEPYLLLERDGSGIDIPLKQLRHLLDKLATAGADLAEAIAVSGQEEER